MDLIYLYPDQDSLISVQALNLPENIPFVKACEFALHASPSISPVEPKRRCFSLTVSALTISQAKPWYFELSNTRGPGRIYLPEPENQQPTTVTLGYARRLGEVVTGPDLFITSSHSNAPVYLKDPINNDEGTTRQLRRLKHKLQYTKRLRFLQIGSYRFNVHVLAAEQHVSAPSRDVLFRIADVIPASLSENDWRSIDILLGQGGFGKVELLRGLQTGAVRAVKESKVLTDNAFGLEGARRELALTRSFSHVSCSAIFPQFFLTCKG